MTWLDMRNRVGTGAIAGAAVTVVAAGAIVFALVQKQSIRERIALLAWRSLMAQTSSEACAE